MHTHVPLTAPARGGTLGSQELAPAANLSRPPPARADRGGAIVPVNAFYGWCSILAGLLSGLFLGLGFHREEFLGGYASMRRRMVRLGHIALVALGVLNVLFAMTAPSLVLEERLVGVASVAWIAGGIGMPLCCAAMAWRPVFRMMFAIPVVCLLLAGSLTVMGVRP